MQRDDLKKEWRPIQWASKKLTPTERRYGISEKEMLAIFWGIKRFEYELRGRTFKLITDHKALEVIRRKPNFDNNRINRWVEKIQEFDFEIEYNAGETMGIPDVLSRVYEDDDAELVKETRNLERGNKIKERKWEKHVITEGNGRQIWKHASGIEVEVPEEGMRDGIIQQIHESVNHRGIESVYYRLKTKWYWPGVKEDISRVIKRCEICSISNRKKLGGSEFVSTCRPLERIALDMIEMRAEGRYVLVGIDYYSRAAVAKVLENKRVKGVVEAIKFWINEWGMKAEELITDNGKEFVYKKFRAMCSERKIRHTTVSVESHRSNGRIERLIGTIREGLVKQAEGTVEQRITKILNTYCWQYTYLYN